MEATITSETGQCVRRADPSYIGLLIQLLPRCRNTMSSNIQTSDLDSPDTITNDEATIRDLFKHIRDTCPDKYPALKNELSGIRTGTEIHEDVPDIKLAMIVSYDANTQQEKLIEEIGLVLRNTLIKDLNKAIRNETHFHRGDATDYYVTTDE